MKDYIIGDDTIRIITTTSGAGFYEMSKDIISKNAKFIDKYVGAIKKCDLMLYLAKKSNLDQTKAEDVSIIQDFRDVLNCSCLMASFDIDLAISSRELLLSKKMAEQMYYIKAIYIHMYKYLERIGGEYGIVKRVAQQCGLLQSYKESNSQIEEFRKNHYPQIKTKRNRLYAHIVDNKDFSEYYTDSLSMVIEREVDIIKQFIVISRSFNNLLASLFPLIVSKMENYCRAIRDSNQAKFGKFDAIIDIISQKDPEVAGQIRGTLNDTKKVIEERVASLLSGIK